MPLYRCIYLREGRARGMTFAYSSLEGAQIFADRWLASLRRYWPDIRFVALIAGKRAGGKPRLTPDDIARQSSLS